VQQQQQQQQQESDNETPSSPVLLDRERDLLEREQSPPLQGRLASPRQRMFALLKRSTLAHIVLLVSFLGSGLILNVLQAFIYVTIKPWNKRLFRAINQHLVYGSWANLVSAGMWWSGSKYRLFAPDQATLDSFSKEHCLITMNHTYELDWLYAWMVSDSLGVLANCKTFSKKEICYVPVIGWNWFFGEIIFLERNWEKDRSSLDKKIGRLLDYENTMMLLMFSEGTRFTPTKHEACLKFAEERGLPKLKHHLLPRPKGFCFTAKFLRDKVTYLYDIELVLPSGQPNPPTMSSILLGKPVVGDMYIRRFALKDLPEDEEGISKFLYKLYEEKDEIMEYYNTHNNTFPAGAVEKKLQKPLRPLLVHFGWSAATVSTMAYWTYYVATASTWTPFVIYGVTMGALYGLLNYFVNLTKSASGSSYGKNKKSQ